MSVEALKNLAGRRAAALRKQNDEIEWLKQEVESWKRLHAVQQEATQRALARAEMAEAALERAHDDIDDGQPDEMTEWRDFDPDC